MNPYRGGIVGDALAARASQLLVAGFSAALAAWLMASGSSRTIAAGAIALLVAAALMRWPSLTVVSLLIVCQELNPVQGFGGPSASGLLFLGHQIYFTTVARISLLTLVALFALGRVLIAARPARPARAAVLLVLALGLYYVTLLWAQGSSFTSAINQDALFALLFGACFGIGVSAASSQDWARLSIPVFQWVLSAMALIGLYLYATGAVQAEQGVTVIFYDSAMGAIAGAAVLATMFTPASERGWRIWWMGAAGLIVVVLSSRRNIWAAMIVALLFALAVTPGRARLVVRILSAAAVLLLGLAVLAPGVLGELGHQLSAIWGATQGTAADASVQGHLSDVSAGWHAVKASPLTGVGPNGHVPGLVLEGPGSLYIHNQVLESWLRFGLLGAIIVVAAQIVFIVQGLVTIKRPRSNFTLRWAALLLLMAPVAMLTAPFLTNTQRWPAVLGFAAGLVAASQRRETRVAAPTR